MNKTTLGAVLIAFAIIGGLGAYRVIPRDEVRSYDLDVLDYGYDGIRGGPAITVNVGDTVEITLVNKGRVTHEFIVVTSDTLRKAVKAGAVGREEFEEALGEPLAPVFEGAAILSLDAGETGKTTFVADVPGRYFFACFEDEPGGWLHVYRQMWGEFTVVPPP